MLSSRFASYHFAFHNAPMNGFSCEHEGAEDAFQNCETNLSKVQIKPIATWIKLVDH